jgi:hypothetical protein
VDSRDKQGSHQLDFEHTFEHGEVSAVTVMPESPVALAEVPWWPDLALAPDPVLPPDPDADLVPVPRAEPDEGDALTVYDFVDDADRADLDRLVRLEEIAALARPGDPAGAVAGVAAGADADGQPIGLVEAVTVLAEVDPHALDGAGRVDLIRGWERVLAMAAGEQQLALASVAEATVAFGLRGIEARHEVGAALRLAPGTAAERTEVALALTERLGDTLATLRRGDVSWRQAADLATGVRDLPDALAAEVQARVLPRMPDRTAAESRRAVQSAVVTADPTGAAARAKKAARDRRIDRLGQPDSMAGWGVSNLPPHVEVDMWAEVSRRARATKKARATLGLPATGLDALRVDSLIDALLGPGAADRLMRDLENDTDEMEDDTDEVDDDTDDGTGETDGAAHDVAPGGMPAGDEAAVDAAVLELLRATVRDRSPYVPTCSCGGKQVAAIVLDLHTALALADNPGVVPGYGSVPPALARAMAADRDWVRWTTDPGTRQVIDRGAETYRPSDKMLAFLAARDRTCGFPGCSRKAQECDCDHVVNYTQPSGQTIAINLGPLCRQHHNAKTHGRWKLTYDPRTHIKTWTSPLGKTYESGTDPPLA